MLRASKFCVPQCGLFCQCWLAYKINQAFLELLDFYLNSFEEFLLFQKEWYVFLHYFLLLILRQNVSELDEGHWVFLLTAVDPQFYKLQNDVFWYFIKLVDNSLVFFFLWLHQLLFKYVDFLVEQGVQEIYSESVEFELVLEFSLHFADLNSSVINPLDQIIAPKRCLQEWNDLFQCCFLSPHLMI